MPGIGGVGCSTYADDRDKGSVMPAQGAGALTDHIPGLGPHEQSRPAKGMRDRHVRRNMR